MLAPNVIFEPPTAIGYDNKSDSGRGKASGQKPIPASTPKMDMLKGRALYDRQIMVEASIIVVIHFR